MEKGNKYADFWCSLRSKSHYENAVNSYMNHSNK